MSDDHLGASGTCVELLRQELRSGLAFALMAIEAGGEPSVRQQHRANAEEAYNTAVRLVAKLLMTEAEMREITRDLGRLRDALQEIAG